MKHMLAIGMAVLAGPAAADQFTTAAEVRPILQATKGSWVSLREYQGQDLLYFTQVLSWRCGLDQISYAVNGGAAKVFPAEPCHEGSAQPNAIKSDGALPYVSAPLGSIKSVTVALRYDDGGRDSASYKRAAILVP